MKTILVGAGGFGREIKAWMNIYSEKFEFAGFLDDSAKDPDVIGTISDHTPLEGYQYLICIGSGLLRESIGATLKRDGASITSLISSQLLTASKIHNVCGGIFLGVQTISNNVAIGNFVLVHGFSCIGHDVSIGLGSTIGSHVFIGGGSTIGEFVTIHPHVVVLPGVKIGNHVTVGAGSIVTKDIPSSVTVFGSPAKIIHRNSIVA
jgi:sugar O-acyltransferase (sialic acid O-acetyltransferase NeuD family)